MAENVLNRMNPFLVSKLDLKSVRVFNYPTITEDETSLEKLKPFIGREWWKLKR